MHPPLFTLEDAKASFSLFCCVYGIGTLGMPANFSRAGPLIAFFELLFMAIANIYASVVCSKAMLEAPPHFVKTYGDLGEWCMGRLGRFAVVVSQMGVCLLTPCTFLVLGGTLLNNLFPGAFDQIVWIILMAVTCLPACLIPTLKKGAGVAFAGCLGTILADVIGVGVLVHGMAGHPSVPTPDLTFAQVVGAFGNLSLAYGAGIVIPALQRQHSDPTRMPRVVFVTLTFVSILFLVLSGSAYSAVGCQIAGNLLFSIYNDPKTGKAALGFTSGQGALVLAYLAMQLHITIAFAVLLHPAFFVFERLLLGMHKRSQDDAEAGGGGYDREETPPSYDKTGSRSHLQSVASSASVVSIEVIEKDEAEDQPGELSDYTGANAVKYVLLRIVMVVILVIVAVVLKDRFTDLTDFIGASAITSSCIVLPIVFYLKMLWHKIPMYEKVPAIIVAVVCTAVGAYVTYTTGKILFVGVENEPKFPFCHPDQQHQVYYVKSP